MTFAHPQILWLLLLFPPALVLFFWWSDRQRQRLMTQFIQARLLPALTLGISPGRRRFRQACLIAAVVCSILALARPQWGFTWEEAKLKGLDIVVAIDTSKSMLAEDIAPNRLARAKLAALDLMQQARSDRLGVVAFAGSAFLQCPLTIDDTAFRQSVESLDVQTIPQGGTALAEAIDTALTAFKEGDNYKVLVLFSDGEDHDSGALAAAQRAAQAGLRIYTVGIGTREGELLRIKDKNGQTDYVRDEQNNVVKSHLNEDLLRQIASATEGGFYLPLRGAKTVDTLYEQGLAKLPKSEHQEKLVKRFHEQYHWPLAAAIALLLVEMLFPERKSQRRTRRAVPALTPAAAALLLLAALHPAAASPGSALRDYKAGKFDQAQKEYERLLRRNAEEPRLHFNAGAAAYRNGQLDEAVKQFNEALNTPDLNLQHSAYFNRGNSLFYLGEQASDPAKRNEAWKKALQDFESSLKLNPNDSDARFNHEFVKKRLEEQPQPPKSNQSDKNQDQDQDKDQNQQQQQQQQQQGQQQDKQDQSQPGQQQQQNQPQPGQQAKNDQDRQAGSESKPDEKKAQAQAGQEKKEDKKQAQAAQPKDKSDDAKEESEAAAPGQMTPREAQRLLDAQKGEELMLPNQSKKTPQDPSKPLRDW